MVTHDLLQHHLHLGGTYLENQHVRYKHTSLVPRRLLAIILFDVMIQGFAHLGQSLWTKLDIGDELTKLCFVYRDMLIIRFASFAPNVHVM